MLPALRDEIYGSADVDALTITSKNVAGRSVVASIFNRFVQENDQSGMKNFKALGYKGYQLGSVRYGSRLDGSALFSTGKDALYVTDIAVNDYDLTDVRTTRIDVCVDIALNTAREAWLSDLYDDENFRRINDKAGRKITLIKSQTGHTLYVGSRESGRFGRIYDKSLAYGSELGNIFRFELETKKQVAPAVFRALFPSNVGIPPVWDGYKTRCKNVVAGQFFKWGLLLDLKEVNHKYIKADTQVSNDFTTLEWLSRTVAPVYAKLKAKGLQSEFFEAVGLPVTVLGND